MTELLRNQAFIDGAWIGSPSLVVDNPATGEEVGRVPDLGAAETTQAVEAAHRAFPEWSAKLAKERGAILRTWFDLVTKNADALAEIVTREQGRVLTEAKGEITYAASFLEFYAEEARRLYGEIIPTHQKDARIVVLRQPLGVVGAITPWNFPASMITRKIAPVLAAGCTVVLKPAAETPLTALALAALAEEAGMPAGVLNMVTTRNAKVVGEVLTTHPLVRAVTFTGSTEVGKLLMKQASSTVKKVALELGGNAPFIVFDDADVDEAVKGAMLSKFRNTGQTCVCTNRFFVHDAVYDPFAKRLAEAARDLKVGNGMDKGMTQGPLINQAALDKVKRHVDDAVAKGAKILTGGKPHALGRFFYEPTVLTDVNLSMQIMGEETFGPVAPLVRFTDEADVIRMANDTPFGLAGYFYTRNIGRAWRVAEALDYGMVGVNSGIISADSVPFGGVKQSGFGREGSRHGMDEYVEIKYVMMGGIDS